MARSRESATPLLRAPTEGEDIVADYRALGLTLGRHPLALLRERSAARAIVTAAELVQELPNGALVRAAGLVTTRQRPQSARGVIFVTLEDETGYMNLVVWERLARAAQRRAGGARACSRCAAVLQREGGVTHVVARELIDRSGLLGALRDAVARFPLARSGCASGVLGVAVLRSIGVSRRRRCRSRRNR